ncbi:MAG: hypothetical protein P8M22_00390 [Phycisphaerales bacterium]|nr:hypothetical protein [Phycisphaerales bacterium]
MIEKRLKWTWNPPRPPWMVVGVISTSAILILGGFLIAMALTYNTRFEQLGIMLALVLVLAVVATMIHILRRNIIRMKLEADESGLRWTDVTHGQVRLIGWNDMVRFQSTPLHRHGQLSHHEIRLWTSASRVPLVIGQTPDNSDRYEKFMLFQDQLAHLMKLNGVTSR